ncbi:leucine--tRNA ligase [candidate division WOR-3 bacterium]|nr:leucine--tRNA ligase [candidate division WOR-3 bacterium]
MQYDHRATERKWQDYWRERGLFKAARHPKKKFYNLVMFAYPSGDIHMGHCKNYVIGDVYARYKMRRGYDVLHPFGWDAFGLPAENQAIKIGTHPEKWTLENIRISDESLKSLGIGYDWDREIITCLPEYYKWTQWMFLLFYKMGLAYKREAYVNWCPGCQTVLANEQVIDGSCYRSNCHAVIEKRKLNQWFFRITEYAERLLEGLDRLDGWPENVKAMQRNWIGRSEGCDIVFKVAGRDIEFKVFTTRPDTVYGVTFMSVAPEHPAVEELVKGTRFEPDVRQYVQAATKRTERERIEKDKDGVATGCHAVNPLNGERVPIFVADYVLPEYGSGVVMGVPAHDARDFQFARRYNLPVRVVINPPGAALSAESLTEAYEEPGIMVASDEFTALDTAAGIAAVSRMLAERELGGPSVHYRLKDWLISRQRYWGAPIPIVYCDICGMVPVPEQDLPVELPNETTDFIPKGRSPLAAVRDFINTTCPKCGGMAMRDPDTMDTFVCSSWYFLRYLDAHNDKEFCTRENADRWLPIDQYIGGGSEHATGHLIYFRFFTKVLFEAGYIPVDEPALHVFDLGMVLKDGEVMSKSKGNTVPAGQFVQEHGADVARLTILFAAPPEREMEWSDEGVTGAERFMQRLYRLVTENHDKAGAGVPSRITGDNEALYIKINQTVAKVTHDLESFKYNTAIAALWELLNALYVTERRDDVFHYGLRAVIDLLSPFAPHLADELWSLGGGQGSLLEQAWLEHDERYTESRSRTIVIQVNGRVRSHLEVVGTMPEGEVKKMALDDERVNRHVAGKIIKKMIYVPDKLLNIVV